MMHNYKKHQKGKLP